MNLLVSFEYSYPTYAWLQARKLQNSVYLVAEISILCYKTVLQNPWKMNFALMFSHKEHLHLKYNYIIRLAIQRENLLSSWPMFQNQNLF